MDAELAPRSNRRARRRSDWIAPVWIVAAIGVLISIIATYLIAHADSLNLTPFWTLVVSLVITGLLTAFLYSLSQRAHVIAQEVERRTHDLAANQAKLEAALAAQQEAVRALRESETRYRLLAENITDVISRQTLDGVIEYVSPSVEHLLGYTPDELRGVSVYELFHPDDLYRIKRVHDDDRNKPGTYNASYRLRRKDGDFVWVETTNNLLADPTTGKSSQVISVTRDMSDHNAVEKRVRENETMYRSAFEEASVAMAMVRASDGRFMRVNHEFCALVGYSKDELREMSYLDITHPADSKNNRELANDIVDSKDTRFQVRKRYLRKDGATVNANIQGTLIRDTSGKAQFFVTHVMPVAADKDKEVNEHDQRSSA